MSADLSVLIQRGGVFDNVEGSTPEEIYKFVTDNMKAPFSLDSQTIYDALCSREKIMSTAVGNGFALPHCRVPVIKEENEQRICVVYPKTPLEMNAPDGNLVTAMFVILAQNQTDHLAILSKLVGLFKKEEFKNLMNIHASEEKIVAAIKKMA
ncbi:MAG: PTS sugar transporter subunit IIA [Spirochaetia bacterium]|nr:PTS sugar transporter subunit IIA [Spirochaetia bacterium]MEE1267951.1 PTS sugar transporter subunit IIA [Treponema sp.]